MNKNGSFFMKISVILVAIIVLIVVMSASIRQIAFYTYQKTGDILYNPMMGFAPAADYTAAVGENTLVYVEVTWRELEPKEGEYDFASIAESNQLEKWREEGKKVVFRFVCDKPSDEEHMDIPDWLYEKTGDGTFYDGAYGKGYSPDYTNETFISYHAAAIKALGEEYGQDSFFYFIEIGSLGHWGEWHVKYDEGIRRFPSEEVCAEYVKPYLTAFPKAKFMMRRPFSFVSSYDMGVYNDVAGDADSTGEWLDWIQNGGTYEEAESTLTLTAVPEVWNKSPIGGELTSAETVETLLTSDLSQTLELLAQSHMTFIGPNCPIANQELLEYSDEVEAVLEEVGYRYRIPDAELVFNRLTHRLHINFSIENDGVAPMYENWPLVLYVMDDQNQVIAKYETNVSLTELTEGSYQMVNLVIHLNQNNIPLLAVGIEDPETGEPAIALDMKTGTYERYYYLNQG